MHQFSADLAIEMKSEPLHTAPTKLSIILTWIFPVLGLVAAILFGVFGVLSYQAASTSLALSQTAIDVAQVANQVALLSMCQQMNVSRISRGHALLGVVVLEI